MKNKFFAVFSLLCFLLTLYAHADDNALQVRYDALMKLKSQMNTEIQVSWDEENHIPLMVSGPLTQVDYLANYPSVEDASIHFLTENKDLFGIDNPENDLQVLREKEDQLGMKHIKFQQYQNGIRVKDQQIWVHYNSQGGIQSVNGRWLPSFETVRSPEISKDQAVGIVKQRMTNQEIQSIELVYFSLDGPKVLCWEILSSTPMRPKMETVVNAITGEVVLFDDGIRMKNNMRLPIKINMMPAAQKSMSKPSVNSEIKLKPVSAQNNGAMKKNQASSSAVAQTATDESSDNVIQNAEIVGAKKISVVFKKDELISTQLNNNITSLGRSVESNQIEEQTLSRQSKKLSESEGNAETAQSSVMSQTTIGLYDPNSQGEEIKIDLNIKPSFQRLEINADLIKGLRNNVPQNIEKNISEAGGTLDLTGITWSLNPVKMNETEVLGCSFSETGGASVSSREIAYFLSTDRSLTTVYLVGNDYATASAYGSTSESISFTPQSISGLTAGAYYVCIFIPDQSQAWVTTNTLQINPSGVSDLQIPSMGLSANPVDMDQTETITANVNEVGGAAVSNREIEYYLSEDNSFSSAYYLGNDYVSLSAFGSGTESISFVPQDISGLTAGTYYVGIHIPDEAETWVFNTTLQINDVPPPPTADLEIPNGSINPNPVYMNETETITANVNEVGGEAVSNREIEYYLSTDNTFSSNTFYLGNDQVTLSANASGTESISFIPQNISGLAAGTYYVGVHIPDEAETWVFNTTLQINDTLTGGDLEFPTIGLSSNPVGMDETEIITATVNEVSGNAVTNREIQFYLSTNNIISTADYLVGTNYVSITGNGSQTESTTFIPQDIAGLSPGTYYVGIHIPAENESWVRSGTLVINSDTLSGGDLEVPTINIALNPVLMSETETITATINEVAGLDVVGREIAYYIASDVNFANSVYYLGNDFVSLPGYGTTTQSISFIPESISGLTAGNYYVGIYIPDEGELWYLATPFVIGSEDQSDLEIPTVTFSQNPVDIAQAETIISDIREVAGYAATNKQIRYYLSTDEQFSSSGDFFFGESFVNLLANGSTSDTISFVPQNIAGLVPDSYYVCISIPAEVEYWRTSQKLVITGGQIGTNEAITAQGVDLLGVNQTFAAYRFAGNTFMIDASKEMFTGSLNSLNNLDALGVIKTHIATLNYSNTPGVSNLTRDPNNNANFNDYIDLREAVSAHVNAGKTYDFYKSTYNRESYDNSSSTITSVVHGIPISGNGLPNNAYWNGSEMVYGDGDFYAGALDIVAHELTHAVTGSESDLVYRFEPGALNEAFSDVFAAMVDDDDWTIGEDLNGGAIRSLEDPEAYGCPAHMDDYNNYLITRDYGGVHTNCGIPSKAAYLMAQSSMGRAGMGAIWYRAQTVYLTSTSEFLDMRRACISAAADLYGAASTEVNAVATAFDAVGILDGPPTPDPKYTVAGKVTYYGENSNPVSNARMNLTVGTNVSTTTSAAGDYVFSNLDKLDYTVTPAKDDQINNAVSALDAALVLQHTVGSTTLDPEQQAVGDVSGNGDLSSYDAALILQYTVGIIQNFPAGSIWMFSPKNRQYLPLDADQLSEDFSAYIRGDVSKNWSTPTIAKSIGQPENVMYANIEKIDLIDEDQYTLHATLAFQENCYAASGELIVSNVELKKVYANFEDNSVSFVTFVSGEDRVKFAIASHEPLDEIKLLSSINCNEDAIESIEVSMHNISYNEKPVHDFLFQITSDIPMSKPEKFHLYQNYPNPFNCTTNIKFDLAKAGQVQIQIINTYGQLVTTVLDQNMDAGSHIISWDGRTSNGNDLSSGVYTLRIVNEEQVQRRKIILLK